MPNFRIDFNPVNSIEYCVIYFSSNNIYFPNDSNTFKNNILLKDRFEWTNQKIRYAHKHIFIRDIKKQWYLTGINAQINSPVRLFSFLERETKNYKIITVGSSAGGYGAILYGSMLKAFRIFAFSPQFELNSLLLTSNELVDPIIFKNKFNLNLNIYYDLNPFILNAKSIYYFCPIKSEWDYQQLTHASKMNGINIIRFKISHHGIPFLKDCLKYLFEMDEKKLYEFTRKEYSPFLFSLEILGVLRFLISFIKQASNKLKYYPK